jgi:hypothetical protein
MKYIITALLAITIFSCSQNAEMYDPSELSVVMRDMEDFSKDARKKLLNGEKIDSIPSQIWDIRHKVSSKGQHEEETYQSLTYPYLAALQGIERGDSQMYFYNASIDACRTCHNSYCGGPLVVINQLNIEEDDAIK